MSSTDDVTAIEADIARHREELAQTVDQLTAKLDVKARVREQAVRTKDDATDKLRAAQARLNRTTGGQQQSNVVVASALAGFVATAVVLTIWRRRR